MKYYKKNRTSAIHIKDKYILPNIETFKCIKTFLEGFIPYYGLNYYGFTLIPAESLLNFVVILNKVSRKSEFLPLISLCEDAYYSGYSILHLGI